MRLMDVVDDLRERLWERQDESFFEEAVTDTGATIVETNGECKEGIGLSYKRTWGYAPTMISLANTREPLYLVNRSGNTPLCTDAAREMSGEGGAALATASATLLFPRGSRFAVSRKPRGASRDFRCIIDDKPVAMSNVAWASA